MNEGELPSKLLALARRDLRAAEILRDEPAVGDGIVGFHTQQAAEKALKAWLTILGIDFPRTHDLSLLIQQLSDADVEVTSLWGLYRRGFVQRKPGNCAKSPSLVWSSAWFSIASAAR